MTFILISFMSVILFEVNAYEHKYVIELLDDYISLQNTDQLVQVVYNYNSSEIFQLEIYNQLSDKWYNILNKSHNSNNILLGQLSL